MTGISTPLPQLTYLGDRLASVAWERDRLNIQTGNIPLAEGLIALKERPVAFVLDGGGALENRPNLMPLKEAPEDCQLWVDCGTRRGEDIIDLVMTDVGSPILPVRHLSGPAEVQEAAEFCEQLMVALDWVDGWVAGGKWETLGLEALGDLLKEWEVGHLLLYHHQGELPYSMPGSWQDLQVHYVSFAGQPCPWPGVTTLEPFVKDEAEAIP